MRLPYALSLSALLITTSGCAGSGTGGNADRNVLPPPLPQAPPPPQLPSPSFSGGLWSGALWWEPNAGFPGGAQNIRLLVAETGEFRLVLYPHTDQYFAARNEQIIGTFSVNGGDISTIGDAVWVGPVNSTGDDWAAFGMAGDFETGESISGTFQANWAGSGHIEERVGTLSMNYHSLYENPSSLDILQGTYTTTDESVAISKQGVIFYQSAVTGCTGNGTVEIIDPDFNMYRVEIDLDNCTGDEAVRNGLTFTGLANVGQNNDLSGAFLNATLEMAVTASRGLPFGTTGYVPWSLLAHKG